MSNPLHRYHRILRAVSESAQGLSLNDLADVTGLPRSTAHRLATSLRDINYLDVNDATGNFVLGSGLVDIMRRALAQDSEMAIFTPALNFIAGKLEETAFCARLWNEEVELVRAITPPRKDKLYIYPGVGVRPLDKCSSSKAILAQLDQERALSLLAPLTHGTRDGADDRLLEELHQVHEQGFAICDGDIDEGVLSVACPVFQGPAKGLYSIGVVGPSSRLKSHTIDAIVEVLQAAAELTVAELNHPSS